MMGVMGGIHKCGLMGIYVDRWGLMGIDGDGWGLMGIDVGIYRE